MSQGARALVRLEPKCKVVAIPRERASLAELKWYWCEARVCSVEVSDKKAPGNGKSVQVRLGG